MKQKMSLPGHSLSPKDMSRVHYTTLGFGSIQPIFVDEVIPKDKVNLSVRNFSRVAPMYLPNLGTLTMKLHAFYVPFRLVWNHFDNFKEGLPSWNSQGAQVYRKCPHIDDLLLTRLFTDNSYDNDVANPYTKRFSSLQTANQNGGFDFKLKVSASDEQFEYYQFTKLGASIYSVLCALGLNFNFINDYSGLELNSEYSLLPLMSYFKVYLDYYIPSQFQPSSYMHQLYTVIHDMTAQDLQQVIPGSMLLLITNCFNQCQYFYQNNYFSSAWQTPNAVIPGLNNIGQIGQDDPVYGNGVHIQGQPSSVVSNGIYPVGQNDSGVFDTNPQNSTFATPQPLNADNITFIQKFAKFVKRSNFAGSRVVERILARYGVRVDDFQIGMSKYLGSDSITLQKTDVTSTTSNDDVKLGDYAGKSWFASPNNSKKFKCNCDYFGMVFVLASLETPSTPITGVRRRNLHIRPLDFLTPEFDGGVFQGISGSELYGREYDMSSATESIKSLGLNRASVLGFSPRYSEYKIALDDVSGNFAIPRLSQNIDNFILPRRIFDEQSRYTEVHTSPTADPLHNFVYDKSLVQDEGSVINKITPSRLLFGNDMYQFNRIFRDTDGVSDPIFSVFNIDCVINSQSTPLNESAELIGRGKVLEFEANGTHL